MKNLLVVIGFVLSFSAVSYAGNVVEEPVQSVGSLTCVSISTSAYTKIPSGTAMAGRHGLFVNNLSSNSAKMHGTIINTTDSAPTGSMGEIDLSPATDMLYLPLSEKVTLYLISLHTSAETACVREIKQ